MVKTGKLEKVLEKLERVGLNSFYVNVNDEMYYIDWSPSPLRIEVEELDEYEDPSWPIWGQELREENGKLLLEEGRPSLDGWIVDEVSTSSEDIEKFLDFVEELLNHL